MSNDCYTSERDSNCRNVKDGQSKVNLKGTYRITKSFTFRTFAILYNLFLFKTDTGPALVLTQKTSLSI